MVWVVALPEVADMFVRYEHQDTIDQNTGVPVVVVYTLRLCIIGDLFKPDSGGGDEKRQHNRPDK